MGRDTLGLLCFPSFLPGSASVERQTQQPPSSDITFWALSKIGPKLDSSLAPGTFSMPPECPLTCTFFLVPLVTSPAL